MGLPPRFVSAAKTLTLGLPLLLGKSDILGYLAPGVAYALTRGRWLIVVGVLSAFTTVLFSGMRGSASELWPILAGPVERVSRPVFVGGLWALSLVVFLVLIPNYRWTAESFDGDEPKYLRMAVSLYRDLDVDVASESQRPVTLAQFGHNMRALLRSIGNALSGLSAREEIPPDHKWNLGNWTVAGLHGGQYYVQSPGLPALLLPAVALQQALIPDGPPGFVPLFVLVILWSLAFVQTALLAWETADSRLAGVVAATAAGLSPPCLIAGYHFYPETVAAVVVPWVARSLTGSGAHQGLPRLAALGFGLGMLPWLHPKFLPFAVAALALAAIRMRREPSRFAFLCGPWLLLFAALLLYDRRVTGLSRPDAFYRRYGSSVYTGLSSVFSPTIPNGLVTALFGARDGLLVMAPVLVCGFLAFRLAWRRNPRKALTISVLFASLWFSTAIHEGGAPGPPGRLMGPAACLCAAFLAVGLAERHRLRSFRWTFLALALVTASISLTMLDDWRRSVNPYRGMFAAGTDFSADLPASPAHVDKPIGLRRSRDLLRGALLSCAIGFWAWMLGRHPREVSEGPAAVWTEIRNLHVGLWLTLVVLATGLHALGP
jgi:hypothetical protein